MLSLPLNVEQSKTVAAIQANLQELRAALVDIQAEYESLTGCILAIGTDALNIIAPQDNLEDLAAEIPAIAYEAFTLLGLKFVKLVCGQRLIHTYEA